MFAFPVASNQASITAKPPHAELSRAGPPSGSSCKLMADSLGLGRSCCVLAAGTVAHPLTCAHAPLKCAAVQHWEACTAAQLLTCARAPLTCAAVQDREACTAAQPLTCAHAPLTCAAVQRRTAARAPAQPPAEWCRGWRLGPPSQPPLPCARPHAL